MVGGVVSQGREHSWSWPLGDWDRMWRPEMWNRRPPSPHHAHLGQSAVILALALYANVIVNEVLSPAWYIPFNLGILGVAILVARRAGTTWTSMGMRPDRIRRGLEVGTIAVGVVIVITIVAMTTETAREVVRDERIIESSVWLSMFHALVRIPLGTALYEEVLFRGVVFGMLARRYTPLAAAFWSSLLFGVWHVLPALDAVAANPVGDLVSGAAGMGLALLGAVVSTFIAGLGFVWIRLYANSIVAAVLAHIGTNSTAIVAAVVVVHVLPS
ncbi:MAG TPA: CPBP family intramembrane glutamic endopeptidase [Acidimicrobiia bacterium]|nr:CPBP family intramembrane glutamic endopeptidase [Acidimicrobiia bacterium]